MSFSAVGEEDEVSIREAAEAIVEAMDFRGELVVSFSAGWPATCCCSISTSNHRAPGEMLWSRASLQLPHAGHGGAEQDLVFPSLVFLNPSRPSLTPPKQTGSSRRRPVTPSYGATCPASSSHLSSKVRWRTPQNTEVLPTAISLGGIRIVHPFRT